MGKITTLLFVLVLVGENLLAQSICKGFSLNSEIFSGSVAANLTNSDPAIGNFSFGGKYNFSLSEGVFYYSPGIDISYIGFKGIPEKGDNSLKTNLSEPIQSEMLIPVIYPIAFDLGISSSISMFFGAGISFLGKYYMANKKAGTVLDGENINLYSVNVGLKTKFTSNISCYLTAKYYFGDKYKFEYYYPEYNISNSDLQVFNIGFGISYSFLSSRNESIESLAEKNMIDSLNIIIKQKDQALAEIKKNLTIRENELSNSKNELKIIKETKPSTDIAQKDIIKTKKIIVDVDSLNKEYNAKFYTEISLNDFLSENRKNLTEDGKALIEGYFDVANNIVINNTKNIFLEFKIPTEYKAIFQKFISSMNWGTVIKLNDMDNLKAIKVEFDLQKIKEKDNLDIEIK